MANSLTSGQSLVAGAASRVLGLRSISLLVLTQKLGPLAELLPRRVTQPDAIRKHHVDKSAGNPAAMLDLIADGVSDRWEEYGAQKLPIVHNLSKDALHCRHRVAPIRGERSASQGCERDVI
jgi:hypothetical protein